MNPLNFDVKQFRTQKFEKEKYKKFMKFSLQEDYYMLCIKKCINDFSTNLTGSEKVCLAKCIDRAHDYFLLEEKNLNPYVERKQSKQIYDIQNMLSQ